MSSIIKLASGKETVYLKQYIREYFTNNKIGLMVCINNTETNIATIGWSLTSPLDVFNLEVAHNIASGRASSGKNSRNTPFCLLYDLFEFQDRCQRYYKDSVVNITGILPVTKEEFYASIVIKGYLKGNKKLKQIKQI